MNQTFPCALVEMGPEVGSGLDTMESCGAQHRGAKPSPKMGMAGKASLRERFKLRPKR